MKKILAAFTAGALLIAGQAAAQNAASARVGDRIGAASGESSDLISGVPVSLIVAGVALVAVVVVASDDDSESD